jgi:hypothetical protein
MKIEISESTYKAILAVNPDVTGFIESAARKQLRQQTSFQQNRSTESLVDRFSEFRGSMKGVTIEQIVANRHAGLL